ncbi:unnamed protein product [Prunus armeniaca]
MKNVDVLYRLGLIHLFDLVITRSSAYALRKWRTSEERRRPVPLGFDPSLRLGDSPLKRLGFT